MPRDYRGWMIGSRAVMASIAAGMLIGLVACAPVPEAEPSSTPTPVFASEEEAFAAAEEVYRAYVDALNEVDFRDPHTFEAVEAFTGGRYAAEERRGLSEMHAEGRVRGGEMHIVWFRLVRHDPQDQLVARTCNDVSETTFTDGEGNSLIPPERPSHIATERV